jgi:hypothetical protein
MATFKEGQRVRVIAHLVSPRFRNFVGSTGVVDRVRDDGEVMVTLGDDRTPRWFVDGELAPEETHAVGDKS